MVPLGQEVQLGQVAPGNRQQVLQVGHELQVHQVYRDHLVRDGQEVSIDSVHSWTTSLTHNSQVTL